MVTAGMSGMGEDRGAYLDLRVWGKAHGLARPYPLAWHLADTAAVALSLWDGYLTAGQRRVVAAGLDVPEQRARALTAFWAGLHDLGKVTPGFQAQHPDAFAALAASGDFPQADGGDRLAHARASQLAVVNLLRTAGYADAPWTHASAYRVAQVLGGHHGRFQETCRADCLRADRRVPELGGAGWGVQRELLFGGLHRALGAPEPPAQVRAEAAVLVTGLVILADWLASQEEFILARQAEGDEPTLAAHLKRSGEMAPGLLADAGLVHRARGETTFDDLFGFAPNPLQRSVLEELPRVVTGPGLLLATAATGDGKTEAALVAARLLQDAAGADGLFFALPTMATSNQMYGRVRACLARQTEGLAPLTLLHSLGWLTEKYAAPVGDGDSLSDAVSDDAEARTAATAWLRGPKRGLLASHSVGTIDQALVAALTTKHNALRLLGLAGKVVVVDEAHAYDAYMQALLRRLLTWLGAFGCPVVLLSATLPASVGRSLIAAYLEGAGHSGPVLMGEIDYPGWLYVDAATGQATRISDQAQAALAAHRRVELTVELRPVHSAGTGVEVTLADAGRADRLTAIRDALIPLVDTHGCAAVVCNTVADAQRTFVFLRTWFGALGESAPALRLLHSRFTARRRDEITREITQDLGKDGPRPRRAVVVATQVIEQSLDLDVDLLVSDLAPVALLLQRAGRCWRHEASWRRSPARSGTRRPPWSAGPRLVVLSEVGEDGRATVPRRWGKVYEKYLLTSTYAVLAERKDRPVIIPDDVQPLVEKVYGPASADPFTLDPQVDGALVTLQANDMASATAAGLVAIPPPRLLAGLECLSSQEVSDLDASTRLGADSVRLACCHADSDGNRYLDEACLHPLPAGHPGRDGRIRFSAADVRAILAESVPVPANWLMGTGPEHDPPEAWQDSPWLRDLKILESTAAAGEASAEPRRPGVTLRLDEELGLVRLRAEDDT